MNNGEIRYCKKCGCELVSTNKHKLCDHCRHSRNEKVRNGILGAGGAILSVLLIVITLGKDGGNKE